VKPRRRRNEDHDAVYRKAFRVCIYDDDRERFLNGSAWPDSIVVSDWYFKGKPVNEGDGDEKDRSKRRRVGSDDNENVSLQLRPTQQLLDIPPVVDDVAAGDLNSDVDIAVDDVNDNVDNDVEDSCDVDDTILVNYNNSADGVCS